MATIGNLAVNLSLNSASFEAGMKQARVSSRNTEAHFKKLAGAAKLLAGSLAIREVVRTVAEFEKLEASLKTVTGSAQNAKVAFDGLKVFAAQTPFSLQEVTNAFIKLKALGLDPSQEALRSYGNTASAMGKSLNQFIEAVADAATGEFERLKEFGIKAKSQGDNVTFTFNGVATTVRKNATEIESYLRQIGETKFAGAMDEQMNTLGGALSNLGDSVSNLIVRLSGDSGLTWALKEATNGLSNLFNAIGQEQSLEDLGKQVDSLNSAISKMRVGSGRWQSALEAKAKTEEKIREQLRARDSISQVAFAYEDATKRVEEMEAEVARLQVQFDKPIIGKFFTQSLTQAREELQKARIEAEKAGEALLSFTPQESAQAKPKAGTGGVSESSKAMDSYVKSLKQAQLDVDLLFDKQTRLDEMFQAGAISSQVYIEALTKLAPTDAEQATGLPGFNQEKLAADLAKVREGLMTEAQLLEESYAEKLLIVEEAFQMGLASEIERKAMMEQLESEHQTRLTEIALNEVNKRVATEKWANDTIASMKQNVFMQAVGLLRSFAGESKAAAYAVIAIEKGLAIAEASMNTAVAITKALTIDPTGALASRVATLGAIQIGFIAATGIAQAAQVGAGGASLGSVANPVYTTSETGGQTAGVQTEVITQRYVTLNVGDAVVMDKNGVRALMDMINEEIGDGVKLAVA